MTPAEMKETVRKDFLNGRVQAVREYFKPI
jgi:hypothetical protein